MKKPKITKPKRKPAKREEKHEHQRVTFKQFNRVLRAMVETPPMSKEKK